MARLSWTVLESPVGPLAVAATDDAVVGVRFGASTDGSPTVPAASHPVLGRAVTELGEYFAGTRRTFDVPVVLEGTEFQRAAWRELGRIPFGETISYAEQAARMGRPTATRAVGGANGRNPVPVIVPCHRVIGKDGALTGFASGTDIKAALLAHERVVAGRASR